MLLLTFARYVYWCPPAFKPAHEKFRDKINNCSGRMYGQNYTGRVCR